MERKAKDDLCREARTVARSDPGKSHAMRRAVREHTQAECPFVTQAQLAAEPVLTSYAPKIIEHS
jgi:hypothetical protein